MYLDVPFCSQLTFGLSGTDPTGCWYASARMVAIAFEAGPRYGVPELYRQPITDRAGKPAIGHESIQLDDYKNKLMKNEGLVAVEDGILASAALLKNAVRLRGPIMFAWIKSDGGKSYGHASTIIGVEGDEVIFHDPEDRPKSRLPLAAFKAARQQVSAYPMARRAGASGHFIVPIVD